jgi:hypothetical protein
VPPKEWGGKNYGFVNECINITAMQRERSFTKKLCVLCAFAVNVTRLKAEHVIEAERPFLIDQAVITE